MKNELWCAYSDYLQKRFGQKVYKVTVSGGFTCPTRDGTKGTLGCAFCDERGSSSFFNAEMAGQSVREQIAQTLPKVRERFSAAKFLAYFQSYTNTYSSLSYLKEIYDSALNMPDVVGLSVGTRPDCIPDAVLDLLEYYTINGHRYVCLELGIQSFRDEALFFYHRGHTRAECIDGIQRSLQRKNLQVNIHLMIGAPGDTVESTREAALMCNKLGVHGVKLHQLMVLKNTTLEKRYHRSPWPLLSLEEYNEHVCTFLEHLNPSIYIERTHALSSHPDELVGPAWSSGRFAPLNHLTNMMKDRKTFQGKYFSLNQHESIPCNI